MPVVKPVFYVEDFYEGNGSWRRPDYFYRRLFWSYLLSGSGVTYGADSTSQGWTVYSTPMPAQAPLVGLNQIGHRGYSCRWTSGSESVPAGGQVGYGCSPCGAIVDVDGQHR